MRKKIAFAFVLIFISAFAFRHFLIATTVELAVNILTGEKLHYENKRWEEGRLIYDKVSLGETLYTERGELEFRANKAPFYLETRLLLSGLDLVVDPQEESMPVFAALIPQRFFVMKLDVEEGRIAIIGDDQPILFTFLSGSGPEKIGRWAFDGLLAAEISASGKKFNVEWDVDKAPVERLAQLVRIFSPHYLDQWQGFKGSVEIHGKTVFTDKGEMVELIASIDAKEFAASNYAVGIFGKSQRLQVDVQYPETSLRVNVDGGEVHLAEPLIPDGWALIDGKGLLVLEQGQEPSIELQGTVVRGDHSYPLILHGKGSLQPEEAFWMEGEIEVASSSAVISLCSPEAEKFILQADIQNLAKDGLALVWDWSCFFTPLTEDLIVPNGHVSTRVTAWWEGKKLTKMQFDDLKATDLYIESSVFPFQGFIGETAGSFIVQENKIVQADLEIKEATVRYSRWHAADVAARIKVENDSFVGTEVKGTFMGIPGEFNLTGHILSPEITAHLSAYPSQWIAAVLPVDQDTDSAVVHLFATYHGKKIDGNFVSDGDVLQFSWDQRGSFKSERLSAATYAPFLRALQLDYSILGDFSIEGVFDRKNLTCNLSGQNIGFDWHQLSLQVEKLQEATFSYNFETKKIQGSTKLFGARGKEFSSGLVLENFEGELSLLEDAVRLESFKGNCSGAITGDISQGSLQLRVEDKIYWSTKLHFENGSYSQFKDLTFDLDYDASANIFLLRNANATVGEIALSSQMIRLKDKRIDFDLKVGEWLALTGTGKQGANGDLRLHVAEGVDKTATLDIAKTDVAFDLKWKEVKARGQAKIGTDALFCEFASIEGIIPLEYQLKSVGPVQFSFDRGLGKFHFVAIEIATQKIVGEIKGDGLDKVSCSYKSLKAAFGVKIALPQFILQNDQDLLTIAYDPWSISGSFQGMEINLSHGKGSVKVIDGSKAGRFFSYDWLKEVNGIELVGIWKKEGFKGEICGKEIEYKGKKFQELSGEAEISPAKVFFKNVTVTDPAGVFFLKQAVYENGEIQIPLIKVQNFRPNKEKPFLIRTLVLSDLKMTAGDFKTLQGLGSFNFTNAWKRESSIFDAPIEMLKNLGLDLALFTPVGGEVSCLLKNGKVYLTDLKNTFSEGERSQFFLADDLEPSYIDLEGLFNVNLRMKQNVVLKFAEPFALTIRGTLEKPEYSLR